MEGISKISLTGLETPSTDAERSLVVELQKLDLTLNESRILVYLMTHGHSAAIEVSRSTGIQRTETYNYLSSLIAKGLVFSTFDRPQKHYSLSIEEAIDHLLQTKRNSLKEFEGNVSEYVRMFESLVSSKVIRSDDKERYNVMIGYHAINAKIERILATADNEVRLFLKNEDFYRFYHSGIGEHICELASRDIHVELKTCCENPDSYLEGKDSISVIGRIQKSVPASFVLIDDGEMVVLLDEPARKSEICGFYTNCRPMVSVFRYLYDNLK